MGWFTAKKACCRPSSSSTTHTEPSPTAACTQSSTEVSASPKLVTSSSLRRSTASAIAPPHTPKSSSGASATAPESPTYPDDPVRSKTCLGTATAVSWLPIAVTAVDAHSRRNDRTRNGRVSITTKLSSRRNPVRGGVPASGVVPSFAAPLPAPTDP